MSQHRIYLITAKLALSGALLVNGPFVAAEDLKVAPSTLTWTLTNDNAPLALEHFTRNWISFAGIDYLSQAQLYDPNGCGNVGFCSPVRTDITWDSQSLSLGGSLIGIELQGGAYFVGFRTSYVTWTDWYVDIENQQVVVDFRFANHNQNPVGPIEASMLTLNNRRDLGNGDVQFDIKLTEDGARSLNFPIGVAGTASLPAGSDFGALTVSAVPEPSTWTILLVGVISVAMSVRRQRRSYRPALSGDHLIWSRQSALSVANPVSVA
jgi:hypothetical protein